MKVLVHFEHDGGAIKRGSLSALRFARDVARAPRKVPATQAAFHDYAMKHEQVCPSARDRAD